MYILYSLKLYIVISIVLNNDVLSVHIKLHNGEFLISLKQRVFCFSTMTKQEANGNILIPPYKVAKIIRRGTDIILTDEFIETINPYQIHNIWSVQHQKDAIIQYKNKSPMKILQLFFDIQESTINECKDWGESVLNVGNGNIKKQIPDNLPSVLTLDIETSFGEVYDDNYFFIMSGEVLHLVEHENTPDEFYTLMAKMERILVIDPGIKVLLSKRSNIFAETHQIITFQYAPASRAYDHLLPPEILLSTLVSPNLSQNDDGNESFPSLDIQFMPPTDLPSTEHEHNTNDDKQKHKW